MVQKCDFSASYEWSSSAEVHCELDTSGMLCDGFSNGH